MSDDPSLPMSFAKTPSSSVPRVPVARAVALVATLIALFGVPAAAQSVSGNGTANARCGSNQSATPAFGDHVTLVSHGECPAPRYNGLASINDARADDVVEAGHWRAESFSQSDFFGTIDDGGSASAGYDVTFQATDVVFTNLAVPGQGGSISASTNLLFRGFLFMQGLSNCSAFYPFARSYFVLLTPDGFSVTGNLLLQGANPPVREGLFAGYPSDSSWVAATTPTGSYALVLPTTVIARVLQQSGVSYCDAPPAQLGVARGMVELSLPCGTPVFNLPPGYTANSAQLGIVNNIRTNCDLDPTLKVTKDALGNVHLSWVGGSAPFTVRRAEDAPFTVAPMVLVDEQFVTSSDDPVLNDGKTYFYRVD